MLVQESDDRVNPVSADVVNNVLDRHTLKTALGRAFDELDQILVNHAGPFAASCVIGSRWRQVNDIDEFTKDGIKILLHTIVSEDASARFAARMARFVGIAVDARCHDGTTTSMLLFCRLAKLAIEKMDLPLQSRERFRWWNQFFTMIEDCLTTLGELKITEVDLLERAADYGIETTPVAVRAAMAYHMAMISSKGDRDLATKVAQLVSTAPKTVYGMFRDNPLVIESEERYFIEKQDYDLSITGNPGMASAWNYKNDTQFLSEDAVIFATGNHITPKSFESTFLRAFISTLPSERANLFSFGVEEGWEAFHEKKRNLIILTPTLSDPELISDIMMFNRENPTCPIDFFQIQVGDRMRTYFNKSLHYMAGAQLFKDVQSTNALECLIGLKKGTRVHCIGSNITISHLYEKDGSVFHPFYENPEAFEPYTRICKDMEESIAFAQRNITHEALNPEEVTYLTTLYRSYTCQEIYDIRVGGSSHDQYANRTVYEDAVGAAMSAVNDGVILGGYGHLARWMHNHATVVDSNGMAAAFGEAFKSIVTDSVRAGDDDRADSMILEGLTDKWSYVVASQNAFLLGHPHVDVGYFDKETMEDFLAMGTGKPILLQAWSGYHEQFKRFRDILPKLANATTLADMRVQDANNLR